MFWSGLFLAITAAITAPAAFAQAPILNHPKFKAAQAFLASDYERTVTEAIALSEIEAPPYKEANFIKPTMPTASRAAKLPRGHKT